MKSQLEQWNLEWKQMAFALLPDTAEGEEDEDQPPWEITARYTGDNLDDVEDGASIMVRLAINESDDVQGLSMRTLLRVVDDRVLALYDLELNLKFDNAAPFTDDELTDYVGGWGTQYAMGYLRAEITSTAAKFKRNLTLAPTPSILDDDSIADVVADARKAQFEGRSDSSKADPEG